MDRGKKDLIGRNRRRGLIQFAVLVLIALLAACRSGGSSAAPTPTPSLAVGQALYEQQCAECHGIAGEGEPNWKQPNADGIYPAPPHDSTGHTWHHPDEQLLAIIAQGGTMPNSQMPGFADEMREDEMRTVLAYIKTFWGEEERTYQAQVTKQAESRK